MSNEIDVGHVSLPLLVLLLLLVEFLVETSESTKSAGQKVNCF